MTEIRAMGGFHESGGMHYNPRVALAPPPELIRMVFPWVDETLQYVEQHEKDKDEFKGTATNFLKLLLELRVVFIQDAACYLIDHPKMCDDHLFFKHHIFQTELFKVSVCCLLCLFYYPFSFC